MSEPSAATARSFADAQDDIVSRRSAFELSEVLHMLIVASVDVDHAAAGQMHEITYTAGGEDAVEEAGAIDLVRLDGAQSGNDAGRQYNGKAASNGGLLCDPGTARCMNALS